MPAIMPENRIYVRANCRFAPFFVLNAFDGWNAGAWSTFGNASPAAYLRLNEVNSHAARHFLSHFSLATGVNWSQG